MANIVVFIEVRDGAATLPSRYAVTQARRVATELGATVYALLALGPVDDATVQRLAGSLGLCGADKILCGADAALDGPALDVYVGPFLQAVADRLRPLLTLLPAGAVGPELGPPLAVRLAAAYCPRATLELVPPGAEAGGQTRLLIHRHRADGAERVMDARDVERPIVVTLVAGTVPPPLGEATVEVEMLTAPDAARQEIRELDSGPDDAAAFELATSVIVVPDDIAEETLASVRTSAPEGTAVVRAADTAAQADVAAPTRLLLLTPDSAGRFAPVPGGCVLPSTANPNEVLAALGCKS